MSYKFVILDEGKIEDLRSLFEKGFKRKFSENLLKWAYFNSYNKSYSCCIVKGDSLIAHTGFIPYEFWQADKKIKALLSVGSVSLEPGFFPMVYRECEKIFSREYDFIYSFPNSKSFPFFIKKFGFDEGFVEYLTLKGKTFKERKVWLKENFFIGKKIVNRMERNFVNWRLFSHPENEYKIFYGKDKKEVIYYKNYGENSIDIIAIRSDSGKITTDALLNLLRNYRAKNINVISTSKDFSNFLKKINFKQNIFTNKFVYKMLRNTVKNPQFFLQMVDNDIY